MQSCRMFLISNYKSIMLFWFLYEWNVNVFTPHPAIEISLTHITQSDKGSLSPRTFKHSELLHKTMYLVFNFKSNLGTYGHDLLAYEQPNHTLPQPYPTLTPTIPYHPLPYPTLPYPTLPYPTLPYPTLPYPSLPFPSLPYPYLTLPYLTLPYPTLPYPTLPYPSLRSPTVPYPTLPYPTLPYHALPYPYLTLPNLTLPQQYPTPYPTPYPTLPYPNPYPYPSLHYPDLLLP